MDRSEKSPEVSSTGLRSSGVSQEHTLKRAFFCCNRPEKGGVAYVRCASLGSLNGPACVPIAAPPVPCLGEFHGSHAKRPSTLWGGSPRNNTFFGRDMEKLLGSEMKIKNSTASLFRNLQSLVSSGGGTVTGRLSGTLAGYAIAFFLNWESTYGSVTPQIAGGCGLRRVHGDVFPAREDLPFGRWVVPDKDPYITR